jgi:hypothetical protein
MFAMVSSNLADLMGASRPRTSKHLREMLQNDAETADPDPGESRGQIDSDDSEHRTNTMSASI